MHTVEPPLDRGKWKADDKYDAPRRLTDDSRIHAAADQRVASSSVIAGQKTSLYHAGYRHVADGSGPEERCLLVARFAGLCPGSGGYDGRRVGWRDQATAELGAVQIRL